MPQVRHHHPGADVLADPGEDPERTTVVEDAHGVTVLDAPPIGVVGVDGHTLLALHTALRREVAVARVEEGVGLRRDALERVAVRGGRLG